MEKMIISTDIEKMKKLQEIVQYTPESKIL